MSPLGRLPVSHSTTTSVSSAARRIATHFRCAASRPTTPPQRTQHPGRQRAPRTFGHGLTLLIRMLEDPSYASIVRWGDEGDSFVVLEVLANHLPPSPPLRGLAHHRHRARSHSRLLTTDPCSVRNSPRPSCPNISSTATCSFVRQLNKYDFPQGPPEQ